MSRSIARSPSWPLAAALALAAAAVVGCEEKKKEGTSLERSSDTAPVVVVDRTAPGATNLVEEKEPNEEPGEASDVSIPGAAAGRLDGQGDVDVFRIRPAKDGYLSARLGGIADVDLMLDLLDAGGERLVRSDRGPDRVAEGVPNYPVEEGETYFLAVSEFVRRAQKKDPRSGESPPYELQVEVASEVEEGHETEPNDEAREEGEGAEEERGGALELLLGDEGFGYLGWARDVDLWELSLEGFGEGHSLDVSIQGVDLVTPELEILDEEGEVILTREGQKNGPVFVRNLVPVSGQARHLVRLSGKRSNPIQLYVIAASSRALGDDEEREPNDEAEQATPLRAGPDELEGIRRGFLLGGDRDYYRLESGARAISLEVALSPPPDADAVLEVRAEGTTHEANEGKLGAAEKLSGIEVGPEQTVYVRVTGSFEGTAPEPYELTWRIGAAAPEPAGDDGDFEDFEDF